MSRKRNNFKAFGKVSTGSINAFIEKNEPKAYALAETDDIVDDLFVVVKDELVNVILENRLKISQLGNVILSGSFEIYVLFFDKWRNVFLRFDKKHCVLS